MASFVFFPFSTTARVEKNRTAQQLVIFPSSGDWGTAAADGHGRARRDLSNFQGGLFLFCQFLFFLSRLQTKLVVVPVSLVRLEQ